MTSLTETVGGDGILKTDTLGRVRTDRGRREAILDEFERSGGSGAQFAALLGIKYQTFAYWIGCRRRQRRAALPAGNEIQTGTKPASTVRWFETEVEAVSPRSEHAALRVSLPGGAYVNIANAAQAKLAAQLLAHLGQRES
jgi:hypothetical protein